MKKRSAKQIFEEAVSLFWRDMKSCRWAIAGIVAYMIFMKGIFQNICPMVIVTGFPCPACGLTRAGVAMLTGHFDLAWKLNPFIYGVLLLLILGAANRYILHRSWKLYKGILIVFLTGMIAYYIYRMMFYFPGDPPMGYYHYNLAEQMVRLVRGFL
ncbi:DUF2752 domain-containing protein [Hespellia stercorisuis]|nr:DUF2752 domain-containing protein [Hespellia stercorisuis]